MAHGSGFQLVVQPFHEAIVGRMLEHRTAEVDNTQLHQFVEDLHLELVCS
jgi:hypothetical protein